MSPFSSQEADLGRGGLLPFPGPDCQAGSLGSYRGAYGALIDLVSLAMTASAVDTIPHAPFLPGVDPFPLSHWDLPHHLLAILSVGLCEIQGYFPHLLT